MNKIKGFVGGFLLYALVYAFAVHGDSGVSGTPYNPTFGAVTAKSTITAGLNAANALVVSTNAVNSVAIGSTLTLDGATNAHVLSSGNLNVRASGAGNCLTFGNNDAGSAVPMLPCSGASGIGNYVMTAKSQQTMNSGQMYAFNITNNGTTCAVTANSPGLPTGWSVARSSAGKCTFTFPSVTQVAKLIAIPVSVGTLGAACFVAGGATSTTLAISCANASDALTDENFFVIFQDWN